MITHGTVTAGYAAGMVTVRLRGSSDTRRVPASREIAAVAVGESVLVTVERGIAWATNVVGAPGSTPPPATDPVGSVPPTPPERASVVTGSFVARPLWSGSWAGGAWLPTAELEQGADAGALPAEGAAFYGSVPSSVGTITAATVELHRIAGGPATPTAPTMRLLAGDEPSDAYPQVLAVAEGPALATGADELDRVEGVVWPLPAAWLALLATGEAGGIGIGVDGTDPRVVLDGDAMTLTLEYRN